MTEKRTLPAHITEDDVRQIVEIVTPGITAQALRAAADVVHSEARWQWELHTRGAVGAQIVAQRMGVVEKTLRGFADQAEEKKP